MNILKGLFPLLIISPLFLFGQSIQYDPNTQELYLSPPPLAPAKAAGANNEPFWEYWWEMGDGHYQITKKPSVKHQYAVSPGHYPRVSMVASYSHETIESISNMPVSIFSSGQPTENYSRVMGGRMVGIATNSGEELIPNNKVEVALHFEVPFEAPNNEGYLLLCYNSLKEKENQKMNFLPFGNPSNERITGDNSGRYTTTPISNLSSGAANIHINAQNFISKTLLGDDRFTVKAYRIQNFSKGENHRLFLTIPVASVIDTNSIKKANRKKPSSLTTLYTTLKAVWVPMGLEWNEPEMTRDYVLEMDYVRDPNKVRIKKPRGYAYFKPRDPQSMSILVKFQNIGNAPVNQLDVEIPWNPGLDPTSITIEDRSPFEVDCPDCEMANIDPTTSKLSCFSVDTTRLTNENLVLLSFYNIQLGGKYQEDSKKKYSKGYVRFKVNGTREKVGKMSVQPTIVMTGAFNKDRVKTNTARKKWRHQGMGLHLGYNLFSDLPNFEDLTDDAVNNIRGGFYYRNTALINGIGFGAEIGYASFRFDGNSITRDTLIRIFDGFENRQAYVKAANEQIDIKAIDLMVNANYRFSGIVTIGAGVGASIPILAKGEITSNLH